MAAMAHFEIEPVIDRIGRHCSNRFARKQLIIRLHGHASQSRQDHIVASGDLKDQDLSVLMVRAGVKDFAVGWRDHLGPRPRDVR